MHKKIFVFVIVLITLAVTNLAGALSIKLSNYPDLNAKTSYIDAIEWAINNKVATGYENGNWGPDNCVLRSELVKMVLETKGKAPVEGERFTTPFPDVKTSDWYYAYANKAKNLGIISGYEDGFFRGWLCVNRAEAMKIATNAMFDNPDLTQYRYTQEIYYDDKDVVDMDVRAWYAPFARFLFKDRLVGTDHTVSQGYDESVHPRVLKINFFPEGDMSRKEVARMLHSIDQKLRLNSK